MGPGACLLKVTQNPVTYDLSPLECSNLPLDPPYRVGGGSVTFFGFNILQTVKVTNFDVLFVSPLDPL